MAGLCALAYVLLVEELERRALAAYTVAGIARALGATVDVPDPAEARVRFDAALVAVPVDVDPDKAALLRELGLREV